MAERRYPDALKALEAAQAVQDTEQVRQEIDKLRQRLDLQASAERTVQDIRAVLDGGQPQEASRLAATALQQYGGTDSAAQLTQLKLQADALTAARQGDQTARRSHFQQEADAALRDKNLRAAALAYEQVLLLGDDAALRRQLDELRATLTRYDDGRRRAAELRRDPERMEDALAALRDAAAAWDTLQVRQEIDDCTLALQKQRDRISVADFEVRGDIGIPFAGRALADDLLPAFKSRFDLVERGQLGKVLDELRLEAGALADNEHARQEVGRLARIRYLVVGSVTPLNGITAHARLIEVRTGLIVQTAKLVVPTSGELQKRLPQLAALLLMTDEQKLEFEHRLAQQAAAEVRPIAPPAMLPPAPVVVAVADPVPPPIITYTPRPPAFGNLVIEDFRRPPPAVTVESGIVRSNPIRQRQLHLHIELGDNLFRRRRYHEAQRHFELALALASDRQEVLLRIERCKPFLPPPPPPPVVVVVAPQPPVVVVARPRIAVFNFLVNCRPGLVPPAFGDWATDYLASYYAPRYEVIERGEVCWYMGRLGITMREVLHDPHARRALAQALGARFFVFGVIQETASFNVETHFMDAESGQNQATGKIHVQDQNELKLRMQELVKQTSSPADQPRLAQQGKESEKVLNDARRLMQAGQHTKAAETAQAGLKQDPNNVALQTLVQQARQAEQEAARRREADRVRAEAEAARKHQEALARQAQAARLQAEKEAKARDEAARRAQEAQREQAYQQQLAQGQQALKQGNYPQAIQFLQSALALKPNDAAATRELAQAKVKQDEAVRARAAAEQAQREAEQRKQREAELAKVRQRVEEERKRREAEELARRKEQETRDQAEYAQLVKQA
ncbi:MAG: hypothetical protein L0210_11935, partial [Rhodospirillales bacterium]|nr:hypothetical protein [Rhodospirillales bacterium]